MRTVPTPLEIFYSCADADEPLLDELEKQLCLLKREGLITTWHRRQITAGMDWMKILGQHLNTAAVILLLISADFIESDYCYKREMPRAMERHNANEACVIPILLRPVDWQGAPFAKLKVLPDNEKPITEWPDRDAAFADVVQDIRRVIKEYFGTSTPHVPLRPEEPTSLLARFWFSRASSVEQQNRKHLIWRVRGDWIKNFLEKLPHNTAPIPLSLVESPEAVANPWQPIVQEMEYADTPLPAGMRITDVYTNADGQLLILGEPGAGKTTLLLQLARDLLKYAEKEQTSPVPVVFNLSSWAQKQQPLAVWIREELEIRYRISKDIGSKWIGANQILPLLDGLDEVEPASRAACMQAIKEYQQKHPLVSLVVCSRKDEYMLQTNRLELYRAVTIQPLTTEQVKEYFAQIGEPIASLHIAFEKDPVLQELATTPLMLTILILAYQDSSLEEIEGDVSTEVRQQQIFATYIQRMLSRRTKSRYESQQTIYWLSYLAQQMKQQSQTEFYIERMQPTWLPKTWQRRLYYGLTLGPICGLLMGLNAQNSPSQFPLTVLMTALIAGLLFGWLSEPRIEKEETKIITQTWMRIRQSFANALERRVMIGVLAGLVVGIIIALYQYLVDFADSSFGSRIIYSLSGGLLMGMHAGLSLGLAIKLERRIEPVETLRWSWTGIRIQKKTMMWLLIGIGLMVLGLVFVQFFRSISWLTLFLIYGLELAFYLALAVALLSGVTRGLSKWALDALQIVTPNQGIKRSIRYGVITAIFIGAVFAVFTGTSDFLTYFWFPHLLSIVIKPTVTRRSIVGMMSHLLGFYPTTRQEFWALDALFWGSVSGMAMSLSAGLYYGGTAYVQHFVLRFLLWRVRRIPFNYPHFLDYAAERILLRKVGGGYTFIHKLLQEYFASLEEKPNQRKSDPDRQK